MPPDQISLFEESGVQTASKGVAPSREIRGLVVEYTDLTEVQKRRLIEMAESGRLADFGIRTLQISTGGHDGNEPIRLRVEGERAQASRAVVAKLVKNLLAAGSLFASGTAKSASATVWIKEGTGCIRVNRRRFEEYFRNSGERWYIQHALESVGIRSSIDLFIRVSGGGLMGQSKAATLALARALSKLRPELQAAINKQHLRTRDSRMKERKKFGRKGARKRFQFSKR